MDSLFLNPSAELELQIYARLRGEIPRIHHLPVRGKTRQIALLLHLLCPEIAQELRNISSLTLSSQEIEQLKTWGALLRAEQIPNPIQYQATLQQPIGPVLPEQELELQLNPRLWIQSTPDSPPPQQDWLTTALSNRFPRVWVQAPESSLCLPFCPDVELFDVLKKMQEHQLTPQALSPAVRRLLREAWILCPPLYTSPLPLPLQAGEEYKVLKQLLPRPQIQALQTYCAGLVREGYLHHGDSLVEDRLYYHNEPLITLLQQTLMPSISKITGQALRPSFCYLSHYLPGAQLKRHTDRPQCVWNLSLHISSERSAHSPDAWPLCLETRHGIREIQLEPGDGVLYQGTETPHWRPGRLPADQSVTVCSMHYVPVDFKGKLN